MSREKKKKEVQPEMINIMNQSNKNLLVRLNGKLNTT